MRAVAILAIKFEQYGRVHSKNRRESVKLGQFQAKSMYMNYLED